MTIEDKQEIVITEIGDICFEVTDPEKLEKSIEAIHGPLSVMLKSANLPTENILMPVNERKKVLLNLSQSLEYLPMEQRPSAKYLSKFTLSVVIGLFDGALNYLWDETIIALRKLIINYDLEYFYLIASEIAGRYKGLGTEEDLEAISDYDLLKACSRIGLISSANHKRLEYVNYFRNQASSAHPNENEISGSEMITFLETCLKYAITAVPDQPALNIKALMHNLRTNVIPEIDFPVICEGLNQHSQERLNDLLKAMLGLYVSDKTDVNTRKNIIGIAPSLWQLAAEDVKRSIGYKYGYYRVNGFVPQKELTQAFLNTVGGNKYKDEDSIAAELLDHLGNLSSVHYSVNNFYNEHEYASRIYSILAHNKIPESIRKLLVKVICICHIGNGLGYREGVDERADRFYTKILELFGDKEIIDFLFMFDDHDFSRDFSLTKPDRRLRTLCNRFKEQTKNKGIVNALQFIAQFPPNILHKVASDSRYKDLLKYLTL